jgi:hypothetical protein
MVLEKDSSVLGYPGEVSKALDADHHTVCKYPSRDDPQYIAVRDVLRAFIGNSISKGKSRLLTRLVESLDADKLEIMDRCA